MIHANGARNIQSVQLAKPQHLTQGTLSFYICWVSFRIGGNGYILGPLPETKLGNVYVLVVGNYFTKWMEAYPIPNQEASTKAKTLVNEFYAGSRCPNSCTAIEDYNLNRKSELKSASCCK